MDKEKLIAVLNLVAAAAKYGIPALQDLLDNLKGNEDPTLEEIEAMASKLKRPEEYFEEKGAERIE